MRDIKFRAWNIAATHQHMIEIEQLIYDEKDSLSISGFPFDKDFGIDVFLTEGQFILMQFTGLQDKDGVDIYEGDIMDLSGDGSITDFICWNNKHGSFCANCDGDKSDHMYGANEARVIGNIHQSPELLNK